METLFQEFVTEHNTTAYAYKTKLNNGFFSMISFYPISHKTYFVSFGVSNKKEALNNYVLGWDSKYTLYDESSYTNGVQGLLWARKMICDFICEVLPVGGSIVVFWSDKRRKNIYVKSLSKLGFGLCRRDGKMCLLYKKARECVLNE